jgi:hypothetical protein
LTRKPRNAISLTHPFTFSAPGGLPMSRWLVIGLLLCLALGGCAAQQEEVQRTGHGINLLPTAHEDRGGYR